MIHLIPYLERELQSKRTASEVADRLYRFVDPRYTPWWDTPERDAASGAPTLIRFQLIPVKKVHSKYNRTFEPIVTGRIEKKDSGSIVRLIMRLGGANVYLLYLWIGLSLFALWQAVSNVLVEPDVGAVFPIAVIILMGLSVPCVMYYHFLQEANALLVEIQKRL